MFKGLALDRPKIESCFRGLSDGGKIFEVQPNPNGDQFVYRFHMGPQQITIAVYYTKDGLTTLTPQGAPNTHAVARDCCERVRQQCAYATEIKSINETFKGIPADSVEYLICCLQDDWKYTVEQTKDKTAIKYKVTSVQGDQVSLTHHITTGTLQVQGKELMAADTVMNILAGAMNLADVVGWKKRLYKVDIDPGMVTYEMQALLPTATSYIGDDIASVVAPALILRRVDIALTDYTSYVFPALRGLEGYIKKLMAEKGLIANNKDGLGYYFTAPNQLAEEYRHVIGCEKTCRALERSYDFYVRHRHGLFHMDATQATSRIIAKRTEANELILEAFRVIETTYAEIRSQ